MSAKTLFITTLILVSQCVYGELKLSGLEYFHSDALLKLSEVRASDDFELSEGTYLGSSDDYVYLKISLESGHNYSDLVINNALIDTLIIFRLINGNLVDSQLIGQSVAYSKRKYDYQDYIISLNHDNGPIDEVYFIIRSSKPINIPISLFELDELVKTLYVNDLIYGAFIGIILVMLFYNLIVYFVARDDSYLYYVAYLLTVALAQSALFGYTDRFLFGELPWLNNNMTFIAGSLVGIFSLMFIRHFLHLKDNAPRFFKVFSVLIVIDSLAIVLCLLGYRIVSYNIINFVAFVGAILALYIAIKLFREGFRPAKFFVIAWSIFLVGVFIFVFKDYNILPFNSFTRRSILIGSVAEVVLLSIALADKINVFRKEKEESQAEALKALRENERIIKEQNIVLEKKVQERTMEIQEANEELQSTLTNLKEAQSQLVDAEKMASLGQLTAGIAHEINNPINFVTSNISPLRRDLDEVYELVEAYSSIKDDVQEGLEKAHELQRELDFDFLKEEIDGLINGISDGANRTQEIVKGLRNFSRLDEDALKLADLNEGLDSTLVILQNKIRDRIKLDCNYSDELGAVECFPGKINQVFMNILNNAIFAVKEKKYHEGEEPIISITTTKSDDNWAIISLKDNGIGMDEQTRKKIFEPFFTTKEVGEGTGLGMSIVFTIIERHGGTIEVISEKGVGTEFIITLPLRQLKEE